MSIRELQYETLTPPFTSAESSLELLPKVMQREHRFKANTVKSTEKVPSIALARSYNEKSMSKIRAPIGPSRARWQYQDCVHREYNVRSDT